MDKNSLTLSEALKLEAELKKQGITIVEPITEVPEGLYSGLFQTQSDKDKTSPVIRLIEYTNASGKAQAFFSAKADLTNEAAGKSYSNVGIALNDNLKEYLSKPENLAKDHTFRSKQGKVRTFVVLADE